MIQVGLPDSGCGVGVDSRSVSAASGMVTASSKLDVGFGASPDLRVFLGASTGRAGYGNLGVKASATYSGTTDGLTVRGSQAFGMQSETMTFGGATGASVFQPTFAVDGSLFNVGRTDSQVVFFHSVGTGPAYSSFRIQNSRGALSFYGPNGYVSAIPGISVTGDLATGLTAAGSTTFTLNIPIEFGLATDITYGLWAGVQPGSSQGQLTPSSGEVAFLSTVTLTGIDVISSSTGRPLDAFTITSGSGTRYDRNGVVNVVDPGGISVPEPSSSSLLLVGLLGTGLLRRRYLTLRSPGIVPIA